MHQHTSSRASTADAMCARTRAPPTPSLAGAAAAAVAARWDCGPATHWSMFALLLKLYPAQQAMTMLVASMAIDTMRTYSADSV